MTRDTWTHEIHDAGHSKLLRPGLKLLHLVRYTYAQI